MHNFPVVIVDNFFKEPDKVREYALSLEYKKDEDSRFPGARTDCISSIAPELYIETLKKFFSIYYDFNYEEVNWNASVQFQKTNRKFDSGWIHSDADGTNRRSVSGIVYLNPKAPLNSGTSIYKLKDNVLIPSINADAKITHYKNDGEIEELKQLKEDEKQQFDETIRINNIYNRLVSFEAGQYHAAQDYFGEDSEERLIMIFFVSRVGATLRPIERSNLHRI